MDTFTIVGATAPPKALTPPPPGVPPPPEYLPEMKDEQIVKNTIKALSPRIVAVHGPTGTGKSTVFPLAITHWSEQVKGLKSGLTICAQPRRILAQQLCERVRSNSQDALLRSDSWLHDCKRVIQRFFNKVALLYRGNCCLDDADISCVLNPSITARFDHDSGH